MCLSPTERFSIEVECHMLPEGNLFDCQREIRRRGEDGAARGGRERVWKEGVKRQIEGGKE